MNSKTRQEKLKRLLKILRLYDLYNYKKPRIWSHNWLLRRDTNLGACSFVYNELLQEDKMSYKNWLRMDNKTFEKLHGLVEGRIKKQNTQLRQCIQSRHRLMVTLRYLSTGESFKSLSFSTRIAACTISTFVPEVMAAICEELKKTYLKVPASSEDWEEIAAGFYNSWNIPNTIGAIDGKHIVFRAPRSAGSHYYNCKGSHSIVLLAVADANYKFIYVDIGVNGRVSDGGVYAGCDLEIALNQEKLNLPNDKALPGMSEPMPYVLLADAAFPLQRHIIKPYPFKNMSREERIFNYRLSRGRRVVENAFGIMSNRFRVLLAPINLSRDKVLLVTQACCVLHNFLLMETPNIVENEADLRLDNGAAQNGLYRKTDRTCRSIHIDRRRPSNVTLRIRAEFKRYFNSVGTVSWQDQMI